MFQTAWHLLKSAANGYIEDNALSKGAAIAYYTITAIAPVLVIVIAIAGLVFGQEAAQGAIVGQLSGLMGAQSAETLQTMIKSAGNRGSGILATIIGFATLLLTASGVFGEMQSSLNTIWKAEPKESAVSRLVKARIASLGLVMALGFLLMVSLVVSAALGALDKVMTSYFPGFLFLMKVMNFLISFAMITILFGLIYKVLPDKKITWRDVGIGAVATAFLFTVGKFLIGLYLGSSSVASSYGAASALVLMLLWIYYSSQIFLFGAEFTKAFAETHGSHSGGEPGKAPDPKSGNGPKLPTAAQPSSPVAARAAPALTRSPAALAPVAASEAVRLRAPGAPLLSPAEMTTLAVTAAAGTVSFGLGRLLARRMVPQPNVES